MKKKQRYGKIEKNILEILQHYQKNKGYAELATETVLKQAELIAEEITNNG